MYDVTLMDIHKLDRFALEENYAETRHWLGEYITRAPTPAEKMEEHWLKAYFDYFLGRWDESPAEYLAIRERAAKAGSTLVVAATDWMTGYLYTDLGEYDLGRKAFQRYSDWGLKQFPALGTYSSAEERYLLGWVDRKQGRMESAKARVKETEPLLPQVESSVQEAMTLLFRLLEAEVFLAENLPEKAIAEYERLATIDPKNQIRYLIHPLYH